jgi:hypothetical protein
LFKDLVVWSWARVENYEDFEWSVDKKVNLALACTKNEQTKFGQH